METRHRSFLLGDSTGLAFCRVQATHGQFVAKKTLADFDKLEKEIKAEVVEQGIASLV